MPNVPNTPMLSTRGELNTGGHLSLKGNTSFNSAYAVSHHFGVLLDGSVMNSKDVKKDYKHNLLEAGAGYFGTFGPANDRIMEVYFGMGRGNSNRTFKSTSTGVPVVYERQEMDFNKYFVQVNYSAKNKKSVSLFGKSFSLNYGTALRVSYINMTDFIRNDMPWVKEDNIFFEPIFFTRLVLNKAVQLQYTNSSNFGLRNREFLTAGNSIFTAGIVINVGGLNSDR
jgi:hypothetical protein